MGPKEYYDLINTGGVLMVLVIIIFVVLAGLYRGWWVPGPFYREVKEDNAKLRETNAGYERHFETIIQLLEANPPARRGPTR